LARLREYRERPRDLHLICDDTWPDIRDNSSLLTAFGYALHRHASAIVFRSSPLTELKEVQQGLLRRYIERRGALGDGFYRALVCHDPVFQVPPLLAGSELSSPDVGSSLPPSQWAAKVEQILSGIRATSAVHFQLPSQSKGELPPLATFIYEGFKNTTEHGIDLAVATSATSTRAIILEKGLLSDLVPSRTGGSEARLSLILRNFAERQMEDRVREASETYLTVTVCDQGAGIQGTLPSNSGESELQTLRRAFLPGQTRKPRRQGDDGQGLARIATAVQAIGGVIFVASSGTMAFQDFSTGDYKHGELDLQPLPLGGDQTCLVSGTSLSVIIPQLKHDVTQGRLFQG